MRFIALALMTSVALLAVPFSASAQEQGFYIRPHINNITKDGATLIWEGKVAGPGTIEYGPEGSFEQKVESTEDAKILRLRMTGLEAETQYNYRVTCGSDVQEATFITAPATARAITFALIGDSRRWSDRWAETKMAEHAAQWNPEFYLTMGDLVPNGHVYEQWPEHFQRFDDITDSLWFVTARGNHEGSQIFDPENDWFARYHELPGAGEPFADFVWGNTHFSLISFEQTVGEQTVEWLDETLPEVDAKYKIVTHHFPVYCTGYFGPADNRKEWGASSFKPLADALDRHKVDMDLAGHTHIFERLYPIKDGERNDAEGVTYIINGGDIGANFPEWFSAVTDNRYLHDQPTYSIYQMGDDRITTRSFCWSREEEKIVEFDYNIVWRDAAVPQAAMKALADSVSVDTIAELGAMGYHPAAEALLPCLDSEDQAISHAAATAIRSIGIAPVSPQLIPFLDNDDVHIQREVARALEIAMEPGLAGAVATAAKRADLDAQCRVSLLGALQFHAPKNFATEEFVAILKDSGAPEFVRERASYGLARTADASQRELLYALFRDEETPYVTVRLAFALNDLTGRRQSLDSKAPIARSKPGEERDEFIEKWEKWMERKNTNEAAAR